MAVEQPVARVVGDEGNLDALVELDEHRVQPFAAARLSRGRPVQQRPDLPRIAGKRSAARQLAGGERGGEAAGRRDIVRAQAPEQVPSTVVEKLQAVYEEVGGFGTLLVFGFDYQENPEAWHTSMELLMSEVLPKVRDLRPGGRPFTDGRC